MDLGVLAELEAARLGHPRRQGPPGSTYAKIPYGEKDKPESQKEANRAHARLRSPGERANVQLKTWRILRKLRCCPWRAGQLAKAIHAGCGSLGVSWSGSESVNALAFPAQVPGPVLFEVAVGVEGS